MAAYLGNIPNDLALDGAVKNIGGGAATGATVGSIFPGAGTLIGAGVGAAVGTIRSIFGHRSNCSGEQKARRAEIERLIRKYVSEQDRRQLVNIAHADIAPTPQAMARFFLGGKDCKHKNVHPADQQFLDRLPPLVEQRAKEYPKEQDTGTQPLPAVNASAVEYAGIHPDFADDTKTMLAIGAGGLIFLGAALIINKTKK